MQGTIPDAVRPATRDLRSHRSAAHCLRPPVAVTIRAMRPVVCTVVLLAAAACAVGATRVESWGTMREVMRDGRTEGRVALGDVLGSPGLVGVGALAGLTGEIAIVDGVAWVARLEPGLSCGRGARPGDRATLLAVADVADWTETTIGRDLSAAEFEALLAERAAAPALATRDVWPFVVEGELLDVQSHVLNGECPTAGAVDPAHAPVRRSFARVTGRLVGFYAPEAAGVLVHHGEATHTHLIVERPEPYVAHVERAGIGAGARLRVPAR